MELRRHPHEVQQIVVPNLLVGEVDIGGGYGGAIRPFQAGPELQPKVGIVGMRQKRLDDIAVERPGFQVRCFQEVFIEHMAQDRMLRIPLVDQLQRAAGLTDGQRRQILDRGHHAGAHHQRRQGQALVQRRQYGLPWQVTGRGQHTLAGPGGRPPVFRYRPGGNVNLHTCCPQQQDGDQQNDRLSQFRHSSRRGRWLRQAVPHMPSVVYKIRMPGIQKALHLQSRDSATLETIAYCSPSNGHTGPLGNCHGQG